MIPCAHFMKTKIQLDGKIEISRFVSFLSLGVCSALKDGAIGFDEASTYLFNPLTAVTLKALGVSPKILDLICLGSELEDVKTIIPQALPSSIANIERRSLQALQVLPKPSATNVKKWFAGIKRQSITKSSQKRTAL